MDDTAKRPIRALALAAAALPILCSVAGAQDAENPGKALIRAKELLRTGSASDRKEAIETLIGLDSGPAISCLEEAIQRSSSEMEKRAKEMDALDDELSDAEAEMEDCRDRYPVLYADARAKWVSVKRRWDSLTREMREHLEICAGGWKSFASFRSEAAVDRLARGATGSTSPLTRQMYIQALGTPERASRIPVLLELLRAGESRVRAAAVRSLSAFPPRRAVLDAAAPLLRDRSWSVRIGAAEVVARMPVDLAVPLLVEAVGRETGEPALQVDSLLQSLTGVSMDGDGKRWQAWLGRHGETLRAGTYEPPEAPAEPEGVGRTEAAFFQIPIESRNLLLVMDLSGSMGATMEGIDARTAELLKKHEYSDSRLAVALVQAYQMIEGLPKDTRFNLLTFSDEVTRFSTKGVSANDSGKKNAIKWLNGQPTGYTTNIWDALRQAFGDHMAAGGSTRFEDLPDTIIFLTDGVPTAGRFRDQQSLSDLVGLWNASSGVVIHCVGIGTEYADQLMDNLASSTGGYVFDSKAMRIRGRRVRPAIPPGEQCPAVQVHLAGVREELQLGSVFTRKESIPRAIEACGWTDEAIPVLAAALEDPEADIRSAAADGLASLGRRGVPELVKAAGRKEGLCRAQAIRALALLGPEALDAAPALEAIAAGADADLAADARNALERIRAKK